MSNSPETPHLHDFINATVNPPLWIVTSRAAEVRGGLVATFVTNASVVPELPRMLVGIAKQHHTWGVIEKSRAFGLHLLQDTDVDLLERFGLRSGWDVDKFSDMTVAEGPTGSPVLKRGILSLDCVVETSMDIGDRTIYAAEAILVQSHSVGKPLRLLHALSSLSPDSRARLVQLLHRDVAVDRSAILAWRAARGDHGGR